VEFLNGFTASTGKNSDNNGLILLVLIAILVLGFGKNTGLNNSVTRNKKHQHHHGKKTCKCSGGT
jgi:hypothetical protein